MKQVSLAGEAITPSKVVCIGRNYVDHVRELDNEMPEQAVIFIKPNSAIADQLAAIPDEEVHYEGEISLLIRDGDIAGVGFGLDLTKRAMQAGLKAKGLPWERAKAFDGAAVFSDFVPFSGDTVNLRLELHVNDELVQSGGTQLMMLRPEQILGEVQGSFSLEDGDIVMTGTPAGVGPLRRGDRYVGRIFDGEQLLVEGDWQVR